jgi:hypothetical protein
MDTGDSRQARPRACRHPTGALPESGADSLSYGVARISCATTSSCVPVGDRENRHGVLAPFVSTFQGGVWTFSTLPRLTAGNGNLADVDCLSSHRSDPPDQSDQPDQPDQPDQSGGPSWFS